MTDFSIFDEVYIEQNNDNVIYNNRIFKSGWYPVEDNKFRWGKATTELDLSGYKGYKFEAVLSTTNPKVTVVPINIYLVSNKKLISMLTFSYPDNIDIPLSLDITRDNVQLKLITECIWTPAVINNSDDWRELGICISNVKLDPQD